MLKVDPMKISWWMPEAWDYEIVMPDGSLVGYAYKYDVESRTATLSRSSPLAEGRTGGYELTYSMFSGTHHIFYVVDVHLPDSRLHNKRTGEII